MAWHDMAWHDMACRGKTSIKFCSKLFPLLHAFVFSLKFKHHVTAAVSRLISEDLMDTSPDWTYMIVKISCHVILFNELLNKWHDMQWQHIDISNKTGTDQDQDGSVALLDTKLWYVSKQLDQHSQIFDYIFRQILSDYFSHSQFFIIYFVRQFFRIAVGCRPWKTANLSPTKEMAK